MRKEGIASTVQSTRGTTLSYVRWPAENPRAAVAIVHGYADHAARYQHVAAHMNANGISACALDLRGHGESSGPRGYVWRFHDYLEDLDAFFNAIQLESMRVPCFVLGHSMGGLVVLNYAVHHKLECRGLIVSSPFLGVAIKVPPAKEFLGRIMSAIYPRLSLPSGINPNDLSHDQSICDTYANDPLVFKTANARWYTEALRAIEQVKSGASTIKLPCLFLQAGDDRLADASASEPLFNQLGSNDKKFVRYPDFFHEIFNEVEKEAPLAEMTQWILEHCASKAKTQPATVKA